MTITTSTQNAFKNYFLAVKPYHSKLLEILEHYTFKDDLNISTNESFLVDENLINLPLCSAVGWGLVYDSSCGFDSISCCDLFTCVGGYGIIFDNSDLTETDNILSVDGPAGSIKISGNHTFDTRKQITGVLSKTSIALSGNQLTNIPPSGLFLVIPYKTLNIAAITDTQLIVNGNYEIEFIQRTEFLIIDSDGNDGIWYVAAAAYDIGLDQTFITVNTDSSTLSTTSLFGIVQVGSNTKNNGIYMMLSATFNGIDTIIETNPDVKEFDLSFNDVGSAIFHTGYTQNRTVTIQNNATNNNDDYSILYSHFNRTNNITTIYVNSFISESTGSIGTVNLYGYLTGPGFEGAKQCSIPKESNNEVIFSENTKFTINKTLTYQALVLSYGPVGFWPLNETSGITAFDISGNNNNGTYTPYNGSNIGTVPTLNNPSPNTAWSSAAHFTYDSQVIIPAVQLLNVASVNNPSFTIEAWVNISFNDSFNIRGFSYMLGLLSPINNSIPFSMGITNSTPLGSSFNAFVNYPTTVNSNLILTGMFDTISNDIYPISPEAPFFMVLVFKNYKLYLYVDAVLVYVSNQYFPALPSNTPSPLYMGTIGVNNTFAGTLSGIALFNYALSEHQILTEYNRGKLRTRHPPITPLPTPSPSPTISLTPTPSFTPGGGMVVLQPGTLGIFAGGKNTSYGLPLSSTASYTYSTNISIAASNLTQPGLQGSAVANVSIGIFLLGIDSFGIPNTNICLYNFRTNYVYAGTSLTNSVFNTSAVGNSTLGIFGGGINNVNYPPVYSTLTTIYTYSNNVISSGRNLTYTVSDGAASGNSTIGIFAGGDEGSYFANNTSIYTYSSNTSVIGTVLSIGRAYLTATGNTILGVFGGGSQSNYGSATTTDIYSYSSNTVISGALLSFFSNHPAAVGNSSIGVFGGGETQSGTSLNTTTVYNYTSNTIVVGGNLLYIQTYASACGSNPGVNA